MHGGQTFFGGARSFHCPDNPTNGSARLPPQAPKFADYLYTFCVTKYIIFNDLSEQFRAILGLKSRGMGELVPAGETIMQIERTNTDGLMVSGLPDGSKVIVDSKNENVFALDATAGAAWDACGSQTTLAQVADDMRRTCDPNISDAVADQAVVQLHEK